MDHPLADRTDRQIRQRLSDTLNQIRQLTIEAVELRAELRLREHTLGKRLADWSDVGQEKKPKITSAIFYILRSSYPTGLRLAEIDAELKRHAVTSSRQNLSVALNRLQGRGKIERSEGGKWRFKGI